MAYQFLHSPFRVVSTRDRQSAAASGYRPRMAATTVQTPTTTRNTWGVAAMVGAAVIVGAALIALLSQGIAAGGAPWYLAFAPAPMIAALVGMHLRVASIR